MTNEQLQGKYKKRTQKMQRSWMKWNHFFGHFLVNISIRIIKFLVFSPGQKIGCLTEIASKDLGLDQNTSVACGLIDAHAGALGLMATIDINDFSKTLGMICGTSTCHMILNKTKIRIPGVWGPYYSGKIFVYW